MKRLIKSFQIDKTETIVLTFLTVTVIWMIWSLNIYRAFLKDEGGTSGTLGDSYGVVTSFFSALGFAGLLYTILLQRKELAETRKEFQKQNVNLKRQRFETSFFSMIEIHLNNLCALDYKGKNGTRAIEQFIAIVVPRIKAYGPGEADHESRVNVYNDVLVNQFFAQMISPYLRSLAAVYEITTTSSLTKKAVKRYVRILEAYLSTIEIEFLFYHVSFGDRNELTEKELYLLEDFMSASRLYNEAFDYVRSKRDIEF